MSETDFRPADNEDIRTEGSSASADVNPEAPEADMAEQSRDLVNQEPEEPEETPHDADPADAAEQRITVEFDDEEYR